MINENTTIHNDEVDIKEIFRTLLRYKISIIFISFIFLVGSVIFAYYKPNIYASSTTIEVLDEDNPIGSVDLMRQAFGGSNINIDNEIAILQSRFIIQNALETLNLTTIYYEKNILGKTTELYKDSPFIVSTEFFEYYMYEKKFELIPIDEENFNLVIKPISEFSIPGILDFSGLKELEEEDKISYNKHHKYGEKISTPWFTMTIDKIATIEAPEYSFEIIPKEALYDYYAGGLSANSSSERGSIITLNYQDMVSLRAQEILNAITKQYMIEGVKEKTQIAELTLSFIDSQLDSIDNKLSTSEQNLKNYKVKNSVINLSEKANLATQQVAGYEAEQLQLQTEINILTNLKHFIDNNSDLNGLTLGTVKFAENSLTTLVLDLQKMTEQKNILLIDYTELHPEIIKLTQSISNTKKSIKQAILSSLRQLEQRNIDLSKMIAKYSTSLNSLPTQEKELAELSRPLKVNEAVYEYLLQKKAETAIMKSSTIAGARVLDSARDEYMPIRPKRRLIVLVGLILGFIVGVAFAFLREFLVTTVQNAEEVERLTSLPIYGVLPLSHNKLTKNIFAESLRNIRTNLQFLPGNEQNKVISITSSVSGEGKTTITASLAEVLAKGDKKVIVLDMDMRKASLHKEFKIPNNIGISNYLTMQNTLSEVVKKTEIDGLSMITTGPLPPNPSELILSDTFKDLLKTLREKYDYVIIDTPPAGLVTDATIIMNYADISFAVVRAKYSRKEFIKNIDRLSQEHSHNRMGIILNGTLISSEYGYGYGASYAYGYGNSKYYKDRV
jgi:tyrosine-protein kinase Etk/Wzc